MISFNRVTKSYGKNKALKDISFHIAEGEMCFLTGHSGAGKTTILKLIMMMRSISYGQIIVNNKDISQIASRNIAKHRRNVGMIFQDHKLLNERTVLENVALTLQIRGYADSYCNKCAKQALARVGLRDKHNFLPLELSSGQQQRVGIARTIIANPKVILADEPTGNLDPELSLELMKILQELNANGSTVLIASHDLFLLKRLKKRVLILDKGELIDDFNPEVEGLIP